MARLSGFDGWRYNPERVDPARVIAPPYDVIGPEEQAVLYARDPRNVVRLILGREYPGDNDANNRHTRAAAHLAAWREEGLLFHDKPAVYLCEQTFSHEGETRTRRSLFSRVLLEEFGKGDVFPHERTLAAPKADRRKLMRACSADLSPVFGLLSDDDGAFLRALEKAVDWQPTLTTLSDDGSRTRFWVIDHADKVAALSRLAEPRKIYIADGHHRYETALAFRDEYREALKAAREPLPPMGELSSDWVLMACVPLSDPGLAIFPTHRLIHGVAGFDGVRLLKACGKSFSVEPLDEEGLRKALAAPGGPAVFGLALGEKLYFVTLKDPAVMDARAPDKPEPWRRLDLAVLHLLILEDILKIDEEKLLQKENVRYERDFGETLRLAAEDPSVQCAFLVRPNTMDEVRAVSHAGEVMPQKSTYFFPKFPSGLVFYLF
ncbi:MAG: DUF1015 domain-containing protein [Planctomycetota bacterium]